jgi:hypothetical protein
MGGHYVGCLGWGFECVSQSVLCVLCHGHWGGVTKAGAVIALNTSDN